jgi:hypothetical protein
MAVVMIVGVVSFAVALRAPDSNAGSDPSLVRTRPTNNALGSQAPDSSTSEADLTTDLVSTTTAPSSSTTTTTARTTTTTTRASTAPPTSATTTGPPSPRQTNQAVKEGEFCNPPGSRGATREGKAMVCQGSLLGLFGNRWVSG